MIGSSRPSVGFGFERGHDRGLAVERVEHRLDQHRVDPAFDQGVDLLAIDGFHRVEIDLAKARIVDLRRQRQRLVGRPDRARDPARRPSAALASSTTSRMIRAAARLMSPTSASAP